MGDVDRPKLKAPVWLIAIAILMPTSFSAMATTESLQSRLFSAFANPRFLRLHFAGKYCRIGVILKSRLPGPGQHPSRSSISHSSKFRGRQKNGIENPTKEVERDEK